MKNPRVFNYIYKKIAILMLVQILILLAISYPLANKISEDSKNEVIQKLNKNVASYIGSELSLFRDGQFSKKEISRAFSHMMSIDPTAEFYLLDKYGNIIIHDLDRDSIMNKKIPLHPIEQFIQGKETFPILGTDPRTKNKKVFSAIDIRDDKNQTRGFLYIIFGSQENDSLLAESSFSQTIKLSILALSIIMTFVLISMLMIFYIVTKPISELSKKVVLFEEKHLQPVNTIKFPSLTEGNEIDRLSGAFKRLSEKVTSQMHDLKAQDRMRRSFLSHISHDLRSPLAGVQGYMEIIDSRVSELSDKDIKEFTKKSLINLSRLERMIDELFELAKLEYALIDLHHKILKKEPFAIDDLLSDIVCSFSRRMKYKKIRTQVFIKKERTLVFADISKISRVMQNLIENAISYTPCGGEVKLFLTVNDKYAFFKIKDSGSGIPSEEIKYVFEPFFRSKASFAKNVPGNGLGLAISRSILLLHNEDLLVQNNPEGGVSFIFKLPLST